MLKQKENSAIINEEVFQSKPPQSNRKSSNNRALLRWRQFYITDRPAFSWGGIFVDKICFWKRRGEVENLRLFCGMQYDGPSF